MSMRDLLNDLRAISINEERKSLLDLHLKYRGTDQELPDRNDIKWHDQFSDNQGFGHSANISEIPSHVRTKMPSATHATVLYDPKRYILHDQHNDTSTYVHHDEPEFHTVIHHMDHEIHKFDRPSGRWKHLHTDTISKTHYHRKPDENAQQFSNRVFRGIENTKHYTYNDMYDQTDPTGHSSAATLMDPLDIWSNDGRSKHEKMVVGASGGTTHHNALDEEDFRHGHIQQELYHRIEVK